MKSTILDADGNVRCPNCGAVNSFTSKRTAKAKLIGVATIGVGAVVMPKRLKCNGCGANLKRGSSRPRPQTSQGSTNWWLEPIGARRARLEAEKTGRAPDGG